jgi:hypothetical protein
MTPLIIDSIVIFLGLVVVVIVSFLARANYLKFVNSEKEIINNIISLVNNRNKAVTTYMTGYVEWLNNDFNPKCIEIFMADTFLLTLKEKYNINDAEYIMSFQNVIGEVQNLNRIKAKELLDSVSSSMIEAVKKQIGEK